MHSMIKHLQHDSLHTLLHWPMPDIYPKKKQKSKQNYIELYTGHMSHNATVSWCQLQHLGSWQCQKPLYWLPALWSLDWRGESALVMWMMWWCVIFCAGLSFPFHNETVNLHYIHLYSWSCHVGVMLESCRPCLGSIERMARNSGKQATP